MTTLATLKAGLYNTFTACGPYDAAQISTCDYGVIERSTGCALFFKPEEGSFEPITFGNTNNVSTKYGTIRFEGECYIQFTGDVPVFLGSVWTAIDDLRTTIGKDDTLQSTACMAHLSEFEYRPDEGYEMGGKDWGVVHFKVTIQDF